MSDHPHTPDTATMDLSCCCATHRPYMQSIVDACYELLAKAGNEIERLSAIVAAVDALHEVVVTDWGGRWCINCGTGHPWPCPTHLALGYGVVDL